MMARMFKRRSDMHLARKAWHMCGVLIMVLIHRQVTREVAIYLLLLTGLVFVLPDVLRQYNPRLNELFLKLFQPIIRENEVNRLSGNSYLISGVFLIVMLFPSKVVSLTLLFLAFADPIASGVGIRWGKDKLIGQKSLQGFLAAFVVCAITTYIYLVGTPSPLVSLEWLSIWGGLIGALSELLPIGKLDDNFSLPVMSATGLYLLFSIVGVLL